MLIDDIEPLNQPKKPKPLDELQAYVVALKAEIDRVEQAIAARKAHLDAVSSLFRKPGS